MIDAASRRSFLATLALAPFSVQVLMARRARAEGLIATGVCLLMPEATEGPFYVDPGLVREEIAEGRPGLPTTLRLQVVREDCAPVAGARVDVWHCDADGVYSGVEGDRGSFCRGTQVTGADGVATFRTVYPGWYPGRTPHVHFKVFPDAGRVLTAQMYFPDEFSDHVYADHAAYARGGRARDRRNGTDRIARAAGQGAVATVEERADGVTASLVVGLSAR